MSKISFTLKSKLRNYIDFLKSREVCIESGAIPYFDNILTGNPNMTFEEGIKLIGDELWTAYCLKTTSDYLSTELKKKFIETINTPRMASHIYIKVKNLTEEEDQILLDKFRGKLPRIEKELKEGSVKRAKND